MARLDESGDRSGAVKAFGAFERRLRAELDLEVSPQTRRLADALRRGALLASRPRAAAAAMVGRERELDDLSELWGRLRGEGMSVAVVSGEPGIGKTRLAGGA